MRLALPKLVATSEGKARSLGRKLVSGALISLTGGVALSAVDDLIIYHGCTSKAMERARKNLAIVEAIGEPIIRGPWYNASLAIAHSATRFHAPFLFRDHMARECFS